MTLVFFTHITYKFFLETVSGLVRRTTAVGLLYTPTTKTLWKISFVLLMQGSPFLVPDGHSPPGFPTIPVVLKADDLSQVSSVNQKVELT